MVELRIGEKGLAHTIPATRLSDGILRFLCLLVILCHPAPPPLVCIEEPELGMHPDILPTIAELLIEASQRTQLIITTHSDILVSNLQSVPEALVICERGANGTTVRRLTAPEIEGWPDEVSLSAPVMFLRSFRHAVRAVNAPSVRLRRPSCGRKCLLSQNYEVTPRQRLGNIWLKGAIGGVRW